MENRLMVLYAPDDQGAGGSLLANSDDAGSGQVANSSNAGQGNSDNAGTQSQGWGWRSIAPSDFRDHDYLKGFENAKDFFKDAISNQEKLSRSVPKPQEGATDEEIAAYRKEMGIPDNADAYELDDGDLPQELVKGLRESYLTANLTPDQAKGMHNMLTSMLEEGKEVFAMYDKQMAGRMKAEADKQFQVGTQELQGKWGDKFKENLRNARQAAAAVIQKEQLDSLPIEIQNNPTIVEAFYNMSRLISDDSLLGGSPQRGTSGNRLFPNSPDMYKEN